jgi:hypothetical protein
MRSPSVTTHDPPPFRSMALLDFVVPPKRISAEGGDEFFCPLALPLSTLLDTTYCAHC